MSVQGILSGVSTMGKILRWVGSAAAVFALTWAALGVATPAAAATTCRTFFPTYKTVTVGSAGAQTTAVQCLLRGTKRPVRPDGSFSAADATWLKSFQRSVRLKQTGVVNNSTWIALIAHGTKPTLSTGDQGVHVVRLQRALRAAGYTVLTGSGYFGPNTLAVVKSVQRGNGLKATGRVGPKFWSLLQSGQPKPGRKARPLPAPAASSRGSSKGAIALAFAKLQLGDRYGYGGTGPNRWDCSGLTQGAYQAAGVQLPHSARGQFRYGQKVTKSQLKPGDLVFFYSPIHHVALYAGGGKVLHASRPGKPVAYITMAYMPYAGARRIG
jgi:cell wall-associated NlpC family hydrolase